MSYTPPAGNAVNVSWQGATPYTPPAGDAVNASWAPSSPTGTFAGAVAVSGIFTGTTIQTVTGEFSGAVGVFGELVGGHGIAADAEATVGVIGAFSGAAGVAGICAGSVPLGAAFVGIHYRYEARGEVRDGGILVDRRVRIYNRATGALINEADTGGGKFAIHTGFAPIEVYAIPIHLDAGAVDFAPPCANRVTTMLAGT